MPQVVAIGYQSFEEIRNENIFYIDKTSFIKEWWEYADNVTLITRPRRFGKTLNLNMLECFFSNQYAGRSDLFEGLTIWENEKFQNLQGSYPVISLSFARIKAAKYDDMEYAVTKIISEVYEQNRYLLNGETLSDNEKNYFKGIKPGMDKKVAVDAIHSLTDFMSRYYKKDVIILLDEYDTPMQEAWLAGIWDEAIEFFRSFFNATFKTNPHLYRGMIMGITSISKESIFSDLNNLKVVTTTSDKYATHFGFTEKEVFQALDATGLGEMKQSVRQWYNGFTFGTHAEIYNPWSIIAFIESNGKYDTYWADTSSNKLVSSLIQKGAPHVKQITEHLLQGKSFQAEIDEQIIFDQLGNDENAIWSLLMAAGYLKVVKVERKSLLLKRIYTLSLTNMEVESTFATMVSGWFGGSSKSYYNDFIKALLLNDIDAMNEFMNKIALQSFSNFDIAKSASDTDDPERLASCCDRMGAANGSSLCESANLQCEADASRFYHGFVLGLIVDLEERFTITSNGESGFGRYDVMLIPTVPEKDNAYIIEFKVHKPKKEKNLEETVTNALAQIEDKQYEAKLLAQGLRPEHIRKYGFAFKGKHCLIG